MNKIDYFYYHWGPYLFKTKTPQYIIDRLKIAGKKTKLKLNDLASHQPHQYAYPSDIQAWFFKEISEIMDTYLRGSIEYHGTALPEVFPKLELINLWINYMEPGDFTPGHIHAGALSFVIFLDIPNELDKEYHDYDGTTLRPGSLSFIYALQSETQWATNRQEIHPKTGDMYIFPSMLEHTVVPFKSNVTRISVSGNFRVVNKEEVSPRDSIWFA